MMDALLKDDRLEVGPDAAGRQPRADDADATSSRAATPSEATSR